MVEENFEKFLVSRRRFIKCSIGGIAAVLAMHSIPAVFPKALAQELLLSEGVESSSSPPKPRPVDDPSLIFPDSTPELNLENPNHPEYGKIPSPKRPPKDAPNPGEADFGTDILPVSGVLGVYAGQEIRPSLSLPAAPPDRTLYAPTLECPNKAPQESVTIYYRYSGMSSTARQWGVWDHTTSPPGWVVRKDLDSDFRNRYVRTYAEGDLYFTEVIKLSGIWKVLLYNFNSSSWETQTQSTANRTTTNGWDLWESYFGGTCPTGLPNIDSTWYLVTETSGYGKELNTMTCSYPKGWNPKYYQWYVN